MTDLLRSARDDGDSVNQLRDAARGAGAWLHRFQEFQHGDGAAALDAVAKEALRNAKTIGAAPALTRRISFLRGQLSARPLVAVSHHGDYWPGNIYASGRSVQVIDLEGYGLSLRSHDVTYFLLHVSLYLAFRGQQLMDLVRESFFEEYAHPLDPSELELCRLATALQLASRDFRDAAAGARFARWKVLRKELAR